MSAFVVPYQKKHIEQMKDIFFEASTRKEFKDAEDKAKFFYKYLGLYIDTYPELALVYEKGDRVLGYVVASPVSDSEAIRAVQPHMEIFHDYFKDYPAHLHINAHAESRGLGVGTELIKEIEQVLKKQNISGLHIMTGPDSPNQNFYKRLGFDFQITLPFQGSSILFMGKSL